MCHSKSYKSWEEKSHAKALEPLKPGAAAEEKTKHKLDPAKDYTKDETCLVCHTVGFGKKGGYAIPPEGDEKAAKKAESLAAVGCESCHGPGGGVADIKKDIQKNKRKYKVEELTAHGLVVPTAATCQQCHTETHPTFDPEEKFDFEKMKEKGVHDHEKLDLKEG
jgi:mono/diheme cytochrome c family protein